MPVSAVLKIPGIGDVITGRVEQGTVKKGDLLKFTPRNTSGKCFSIEMHHRQVMSATGGDNVGINVKGLKDNMPKPVILCILKMILTKVLNLPQLNNSMHLFLYRSSR